MGDALKRVVSRAISDAAFRRHLQTNPKAALKESLSLDVHLTV